MMNKKTPYLLILLMVISSFSFAQTQEELKETVLRDVKIFNKAKLKLDYETVVKHTHPNVIETNGGKAKTLASLKETYAKFKKNRTWAYEKASAKNVSDIVFENGEYRCFIENYDQIKRDDTRTKSTNYLLATYNANAKIWCFVKARELKGEKGTVIFPEYKTSLDIPKDVVTKKRL